MFFRNFLGQIRFEAPVIVLVGILGCCLVLGGCAKWKSTEQQAPAMKFPSSRMSPDSVALEVAVAQLDASQVADLAELWNQVDQQEVPLVLRKRLDANGIRMAVVPSQIPGVLHKLLTPKEIDTAALDSLQIQMHEKGLLKPAARLISHNKIQNRDGKAYDLHVSNVYTQTSWLIHTINGSSAGAGKSVRGVMSVKTYPSGNGSVRIKLTPQIHHGDPRTEIGVVDRSFLFQNRQSIVELKELQAEVSLLPGETLIVGPTSDVADLGELFFSVPGAVHGCQRIVLIRLVQTQWDDLFGWRDGGEKLISAPQE